jgi:hypothetical protein
MKTTIAVTGTLVAAGLAVTIGAATVIAVAEDDDAAADHLVEGDGYSYTLPAGWSELPGSSVGQGELGIDTMTTSGDGYNATVGVATTSVMGGPLTETYAHQALQGLAMAPGSTSTPDIRTDEVTIDGAPAVRGEVTVGAPDRPVTFVSYIARHEGTQFMVKLVAMGPNGDDSEAAFERLMDTWTWDQSDADQPA